MNVCVFEYGEICVCLDKHVSYNVTGVDLISRIIGFPMIKKKLFRLRKVHSTLHTTHPLIGPF